VVIHNSDYGTYAYAYRDEDDAFEEAISIAKRCAVDKNVISIGTGENYARIIYDKVNSVLVQEVELM
jgi:transposase